MRRLSVVLVLCLLALLIGTYPAAAEKLSPQPAPPPPLFTNLVYNSGFETPDPSFPTRPDGWTMWYGGGLDAPTFTLSDPFQGLHSVAIDSHSGNSFVNLASRTFGLTPGTILRVSMAERVPDWTPQGCACILPEVEIYNSQNQLIAVDQFYFGVSSTEWRHGSGSNHFNVPTAPNAGVSGRLVLHMEPLGAQHTDFVDNVAVWISPPK
jgi:hypothetical protein